MEVGSAFISFTHRRPFVVRRAFDKTKPPLARAPEKWFSATNKHEWTRIKFRCFSFGLVRARVRSSQMQDEANCWELLHIQCVPYSFRELEKRSQPGWLFGRQILQNEAMPELQPLPDAFAMMKSPAKGNRGHFARRSQFLRGTSISLHYPPFRLTLKNEATECKFAVLTRLLGGPDHFRVRV
jgi:hypothetical protein